MRGRRSGAASGLLCGRRGDDAQLVLGTDGVLHEACGEGFFQGPQLAFGKARDNDVHLKGAEMEGAAGGLRADADRESAGGETAGTQVLGHVLANAAAQRGEQELGRRQALIGSAVFGRLVEDDTVVARHRGESSTAVVFESDLHADSGLRMDKAS